jgi:hypothetical protein
MLVCFSTVCMCPTWQLIVFPTLALLTHPWARFAIAPRGIILSRSL